MSSLQNIYIMDCFKMNHNVIMVVKKYVRARGPNWPKEATSSGLMWLPKKKKNICVERSDRWVLLINIYFHVNYPTFLIKLACTVIITRACTISSSSPLCGKSVFRTTNAQVTQTNYHFWWQLRFFNNIPLHYFNFL